MCSLCSSCRFLQEGEMTQKFVHLHNHSDFSLLDGAASVKKLVAKAKELGGKIEIVSFVRYEKGEGLEKKVDDFASEVASMVK